MRLTRREFLIGGLGVSLTVPITQGYTGATEDLPQTTEIEIPFEALPRDFAGYRIAFFGDTHLGQYLSTEYLRGVVNQVNSLKPDLIILGGDYIWREKSLFAKTIVSLTRSEYHDLQGQALVDKILSDTASIFANLKAPDGVFGVIGNHDHWESGKGIKRLFSEYRCANILINEESKIKRGNSQIRILGVDDYWTGIPKSPAHWRKELESDFKVLISHNPDFVSEQLRLNSANFNLALCAHTHGGQVKLPLVGAMIKNVYDARFLEGRIPIEPAKKEVFVTRGIGMVELPIRLNCPPEIALITLNPV